MAQQNPDKVPNTKIADDPNADAIWHRWFEQLLRRINTITGLLHNALSGLQGGTTNEYYHLTAAEHGNIDNISASKLLGRGSGGGAGAVQQITLGGGLAMTGTTLSASGSGGVTSVDASGSELLTFSGGPITTTGTLVAQTGSLLAFSAAHG